MKKNINFLSLIFLSFMIFITNVTADSGFDVDYSSGGGSYSGSSGGSYSSGSSGNSDFGGFFATTYVDFIGEHPILTVIFIVFAVLFLLFIVIFFIKKIILPFIDKKKKKKYLIKQLPIKYSNFQKQVINLFKNLQISWMNFELDKVKNELTDELYNKICRKK